MTNCDELYSCKPEVVFVASTLNVLQLLAVVCPI